MSDIYNKSKNLLERTRAMLKKQKWKEKEESPSSWKTMHCISWYEQLFSTCGPFCQSAVDLTDDGVCSESCKPLDVQTFKSATILTDLGSERRESSTQNNTLKPLLLWYLNMSLI